MNSGGLKTHIFYCANNLAAEQLAQMGSGLEGGTVRTISLPCSGKVDVPYLLKAFETGADAVVLVTCKQNECQHLEGNTRARKRAETVDALLAEIGLGTGRLVVVEGESAGAAPVAREIRQFLERLKDLPPATPGGGPKGQDGIQA